jgi:hypothetical protein
MPHKLPTIEELRPLCADYATAALVFLTDAIKEHDEPGDVLSAFEKWAESLSLFRTHGVEHVGDDAFPGELAYLNTGDSYGTTLAYDTQAGAFLVTSWADWMEARETEHTEETDETRCPYCGEWAEETDPDNGYCLPCAKKEGDRNRRAAVRREFHRFRPGRPASTALRIARALVAFRDQDGETMRFRYEPDQDPDLSFLDQDCYQGDSQGRRCADRIRAMAEHDGVWVCIVETRCPTCEAWTVRDTIGGCIGSPGFSDGDDGNCLAIEYAADMIHAALSAQEEHQD